MIKTILKLVVLLLYLSIIGCANETRDSILRGDTCLVNNNFCDAISHYRTTLTLSPDYANAPKFAANLHYAKKECSRFHYREGADFVSRKQFDEAVISFKTALSIDPDNKKARMALEHTHNVKADSIMTAVDRYNEGMALAAKKDWRNAMKQFQLALAINPKLAEVQIQIDRSSEQIEQAEGIYNASLPLLEKNKWVDAVTEFEKVLAIDPAHPHAGDKLRIVRNEIAGGRDFFLKGEAALKQDNRAEAILLFKKAVQHNADQSEARNALADLYYRIANEQGEKGNAGNAVLFYTKALSLQPGHKGASVGVMPQEEIVRQRINCNLALLPLKEYARDPDLSNGLYAALRKKMLATEKGFVKIIDNKPVEKFSEDNDIPVEKLNDGKNITLLKSLAGVSAVLTGKISAFKISSEKKAESLSKQYQSGTNQRKNPEYAAAVANARLANVAAEATRRAAAQAGGIFDLLGKVVGTVTDANASVNLANTPEYIDEPAYSTWRYKIIHHKKKAEVSVSFRLVDTESGELLADESIPAHIELSGDSVDNPNPEIGIEDKPLPFDSDDDLKVELIAKASDQIAEKLAVTMQKYAKRHLLAAQSLEAASDRVKAVEKYMDFIHAIPNDNSTYANELKKIREYLESVEFNNQM